MPRDPAVLAGAAILFLYLFQRPEADTATSCIIFGIWASSMLADLKITFASRSLIPRYERSVVLSFAYGRLRPRHAALTAVAVESACVAFLPAAATLEPDAASSCAVAYFFSMLHAAAIDWNGRFTRNMRYDPHSHQAPA